jgi:hypothetical protein
MENFIFLCSFQSELVKQTWFYILTVLAFYNGSSLRNRSFSHKSNFCPFSEEKSKEFHRAVLRAWWSQPPVWCSGHIVRKPGLRMHLSLGLAGKGLHLSSPPQVGESIQRSV